MNFKTIEGIKKLILHRIDDFEILEPNRFGGEPLLDMDIIKEMMGYALTLKRDHNFVLYSTVTTNGSLLTIKNFKIPEKLNINKYVISFDGDHKEHNKLRITRNATPTFDIIYNNILNFHKSVINAKIQLSLHLNKYNYNSMLSFINRISKDLNDNSRFTIFIRELSRLGEK